MSKWHNEPYLQLVKSLALRTLALSLGSDHFPPQLQQALMEEHQRYIRENDLRLSVLDVVELRDVVNDLAHQMHHEMFAMAIECLGVDPEHVAARIMEREAAAHTVPFEVSDAALDEMFTGLEQLLRSKGEEPK